MHKLIVIEGLDGSGKATQAQFLFEKLLERGLPVRKVSFPNYDSPSSALVKMYLSGEFGTHPDDVNAYAASAFYAVDRFASFKKDWEKHYRSGLIIADRYTTSNAVHQCSKLKQSEWDSYLHWLFDFEYRLLGIPEPDLVLYLRVDPELSQHLLEERYEGRDKRDIHEKDLSYLAHCRAAADYCAKKLGWKTIECTENGRMRSAEDIDAEIMTVVQMSLEGEPYGRYSNTQMSN